MDQLIDEGTTIHQGDGFYPTIMIIISCSVEVTLYKDWDTVHVHSHPPTHTHTYTHTHTHTHSHTDICVHTGKAHKWTDCTKMGKQYRQAIQKQPYERQSCKHAHNNTH